MECQILVNHKPQLLVITENWILTWVCHTLEALWEVLLLPHQVLVVQA
jgi:hypothetical protein